MKKLLQFLFLSFSVFLIKYILSIAVVYTFPTYISNTEAPLINESLLMRDEKPEFKLSAIWSKHQSVSFIDVAINGYQDIEAEETRESNFSVYPFYPLVISGFFKGFPVYNSAEQYYVIGALLSSLFFGVALYFLDKLMERLYILDDKKYFVYLLLLTFPGSFVFNLIYSESLFLLLLVSSLYLLFCKKYIWSFALLGLMTVTRFIGLVFLIPYLYYFIINERFNKRVNIVPKSVLFAVITTLPLLVYYYHLFAISGDFFAALREKSDAIGFMYLPFGYLFDYLQSIGFSFHPIYTLNLLVLLASLSVLIFIFVRLFLVFEFRSTEQISLFISFAIYVLAMTALSAEAPLARYLSVCIPGYLMFATTSNMYVRSNKFLSIMLVFLSLQIMYFLMFLVGAPIGV